MVQLPYTYPIEWLSRRASSPDVLLRGGGAETWLGQMIAKMLPVDEVRKFNSPPLAWQRRRGRFGYALVRDGRPIEMVVLRLN